MNAQTEKETKPKKSSLRSLCPLWLCGEKRILAPFGRPFYIALSEAILDEDKVQALDQFDQWKKVKPISLDEPWDMTK